MPGLERLPDSLLEASGDLGAAAWRTVRSVVLPLVFPSVVAGSIFTFSLSLGDYIAVQIVGGKNQLLGNLIQTNVGCRERPADGRRDRHGPRRRDGALPAGRAPHRRPGQPVTVTDDAVAARPPRARRRHGSWASPSSTCR